MDTNIDDMTNEVKNIAGGAVGDMVKEKATEISAPEIAKLEELADSVGLGSLVKSAVEAVEGKVGIDLDGDKNIGQ